MNPAAHGTKHCQRISPAFPVRIVNVIVSCAFFSEQGICAHWLGALSATPWIGTETWYCGIVNVCEASSGLITLVVLPFRVISPPTVPSTWDKNGFLRALA